MSFYSITESNLYKPTTCDYLNYTKLSKFNKFYLTNKNFSNKHSIKSPLIKNPDNKRKLFTYDNPITPIKINKQKSQIILSNSRHLSSKAKSYKDINNSSYNSTKIKRNFNPDILGTEYISLPKKQKKRKCNLDIPKYNTFLAKKIKKKSLYLNTFDYISGKNYKFLSTTYFNKPIINKSIKDIKIRNKFSYNKKDSISDSMNLLIERAKKSSKKAATYMIKKFEQKLIYDKRENIKEYNKFMNALQANLNKSKSKSKISKRFIYEY